MLEYRKVSLVSSMNVSKEQQSYKRGHISSCVVHMVSMGSSLDFKPENPLKPADRRTTPIISADWPIPPRPGRFSVGFRQPLKMLGALNLAPPS
jgi:hypothetical protein